MPSQLDKDDAASEGEAIEQSLGALVEDDEFQALSQHRARFNIFEAVGAQAAEIRHSNFLQFLLSPSRSHGLGNQMLAQFLRRVLEKLPPQARPLRTLELAIADLDDAIVYREVDNIDLLIEVRSLRVVVAVENKFHSGEGDGQLVRYKGIIERRYNDWRRLFVFLTPTGMEPSDSTYLPLSYSEIGQIIERILEGQTGANDALVAMRHYMEMLRRNIVPDEKLEELAKRLYEKYYDAFEFVFKHRPEPDSLIKVVRGLVAGIQGLEIDSEGQNILRFYPTAWDTISSLGPSTCAGWTRSGRSLMFEVKAYNQSFRLSLALVLGPASAEVRSALYEAATARPETFTSLVKPMGRKWASIFVDNLLTDAEASNMDEMPAGKNLLLAATSR